MFPILDHDREGGVETLQLGTLQSANTAAEPGGVMNIKKAGGVAPARFISLRSVFPPATVCRFGDCQWEFVPLISVPGRFTSGLLRLVLGGEELQRIDVENQLPGECVVVPLVAFGLTATADQQLHAFGDVLLELFGSLSPHFGGDPIREFAVTDAPRAGDVDVEDGG